MFKPKLAILTEAIRFDNQDALKYFSKIEPVHFYESAPYGDLKKEELKNAIQYHSMADLEQKLLELKPDIIQGAEPYASRYALKLCLLAKKVARKLNIPLIFPMLENRPVRDRFGLVGGYFLKKILKSYTKQASLIFYLNEGAKRNLLEVGTDPKKMVKMLYGIWGVETEVFKPNEKIKNQNEKLRKILFIGRIDEAKGVSYLMGAWNIIKSEFPDVELVLAGSGVLVPMITGERVRKLGMVKNTDLPQIINESLFVVLPSVTLPRWEEQVGMTNLQALSCGVPVITTTSGAIPEYVTSEVGILVPERDAEALAAAMRKLLADDNLRLKMGQKARAYILEKYDARETIEKVEKILLNLVQSK
jgi:glycosyltransferase involved in cell wall biosynthesis